MPPGKRRRLLRRLRSSGNDASCVRELGVADLNTIISILFDGLAYAMFLFIVSVGLSVTMGLMGFVNLAHGAFAMAGGYLVLTAHAQLGRAVPASRCVIVFLVVGAVSVVFERMLYARLYEATELDQVLLTIGLAFMAIADLHLSLRTEAADHPAARAISPARSRAASAAFRPTGCSSSRSARC